MGIIDASYDSMPQIRTRYRPEASRGRDRPHLIVIIWHVLHDEAAYRDLLGARHGTAGLPGHWQSGLELRRIIIQIAADAALEFGPAEVERGPPWSGRRSVATVTPPRR